MAKGYIKTTTTRQIKNGTTRRGNPKYKTVKETVKTTATNQSKGAGVQQQTRPLKTDKAINKAREIQSNENIAKAKIAGRSADIATITAGVASTLRKGIGVAQPANTQVHNTDSGVDQSINGGVSNGANNRDEDDDNPFID